jgi:hypothetical protein
MTYFLAPMARKLMTAAVSDLLHRTNGQAVVNTANMAIYEDMILDCYSMVLRLVDARAAEGDAESAVQRIIEATFSDPALPARFQRLFIEGVKSPAQDRRRLLALALLGFGANTPERDRIDAAVERLFPADVLLLKKLVEHVDGLASGEEEMLLVRPHEGERFAGIIKKTQNGLAIDPDSKQVPAPDMPLYALNGAGCILVELEINAATHFGNLKAHLAPLRILPLGRALYQALQGTQIDIELATAARSSEA